MGLVEEIGAAAPVLAVVRAHGGGAVLERRRPAREPSVPIPAAVHVDVGLAAAAGDGDVARRVAVVV